MRKYNKRYIGKPAQITDDFELLAYIGADDLPQVETPHKKYDKTNLAFNPDLELFQVYISAESKEGIEEFKQDYPNYRQCNANLIGNWYVLVFPTEDVPENATALDSFFQGLSRDSNESNS